MDSPSILPGLPVVAQSTPTLLAHVYRPAPVRPWQRQPTPARGGTRRVRRPRLGPARRALGRPAARRAGLDRRRYLAGRRSGPAGGRPLAVLRGEPLPVPDRYDGFHLVLATAAEVRVWSWDGEALRDQRLAPGDHVIVNAGVDAADPSVADRLRDTTSGRDDWVR